MEFDFKLYFILNVLVFVRRVYGLGKKSFKISRKSIIRSTICKSKKKGLLDFPYFFILILCGFLLRCYFVQVDWKQSTSLCNNFLFLTHFIPLVSFYTPWKHQKIKDFQTKRPVAWNGLIILAFIFRSIYFCNLCFV